MNLEVTNSRGRIGRRRVVWMEKVGAEREIRPQLEVLRQASLFCRMFGNSVELIYIENGQEHQLTLKEWKHNAEQLTTTEGQLIPLAAIRYIYIV